jgi:hypothetical protein
MAETRARHAYHDGRFRRLGGAGFGVGHGVALGRLAATLLPAQARARRDGTGREVSTGEGHHSGHGRARKRGRLA